MTKSKAGMVTRGIIQLATDTLPLIVKESVFLLLPLDISIVTHYSEWISSQRQ